MKTFGYNDDTCTPHRPQTNGIAERAVRRVREGTRCAQVQSGLTELWWREAMNCFCFLYNVTDLQSNRATPYRQRFMHDFLGKVMPFGCEVHYKPSTPDDVKRLHTFGHKTLSGIFMGYAQEGWRRLDR